MDVKRTVILFIVLGLIFSSIYYLESQKPKHIGNGSGKDLVTSNGPVASKAHKFPSAKEIADPAGFINTTPFKLSDLIGKKVILVDFWTYSCINCIRTIPHLNDWYKKYSNQGLTIVGIHTPEFDFEKKLENVQAAVDKYNIKYPVVLDNNYGTWQAYGNSYWPRQYLIDIDGYIAYDHIGEGSDEEIERKIQDLLQERSARLKTKQVIDQTLSQSDSTSNAPTDVGSPETYFGSNRNEYLGNGQPSQTGVQQLTTPKELPRNKLFLNGKWDFQPEYASNLSTSATISFHYHAKSVYLVASADQPITVQILRDGRPAGNVGGEDTHTQNNLSTVTIKEDRLYKIIEDNTAGEHTLELRVESPGLKAYTFTFG